ncbi:MAG: hypothetical protein LBP51_05430 [Deferribacteraceae bacterium]|jgi:hypothetical protein|nr:hypothetical protein [Deferribacteraceae bacterium]
MARTLNFNLSGKDYEASPEKIDRGKLYGAHEILALDDDGGECKLASMDDSGTVIITQGATALASLSESGRWVDKGELVAVKQDGTPAELIPSSYSHSIPLTETVSEEEYLNYNIAALYSIFDESGSLAKEIGDKIYAFDYSYLDSYEASRAFLLTNGDDLFMAVGAPVKCELVGLAEAAAVDAEESEAPEDDGLDFGMF